MRNVSLGRVLVVASVLVAANRAYSNTAGTSDWPQRASIQIGTMPRQGVVEFALTPAVFDLAREDLADLRVAAETGEEAPYVLRAAEDKTESVRLEVRLYNRTYISGKQSSVTVDFGSKVLKNRIEVETPGMDFRRRVLVEGSDDGQSWQKVREGAFLFRIGAHAAGWKYDKSLVALPENDQRYLRVTVYNAPDDPQRVEIQDVRTWRRVHEPAQSAPVPLLSVQVEENEKEHATDIVLDLGCRNLPLHELTLKFADANFFRPVRVEGRNREERVIQTRAEDGPPREKVVEEPWHLIKKGVLYRYSSGASPDESLTVPLRGARQRYLRVRIQNADDPPLSFDGASVTRLLYHVAFQPKCEGPYALYFGDSRARPPRYDIVHYIGRLRDEGTAGAALGQVTANPDFRREEARVPWGERHKWVIWIALLAALAVLGLLVYRQAKTAPQSAE